MSSLVVLLAPRPALLHDGWMPSVFAHRRLAALCLSFASVGAACGPEPVYDDDIGVTAIPVQPGEAAGTFATKVLNTTLVKIPVIGDAAGGGVNYRLLTRTWDDATQRYEQSSVLCGGFNFEVAGVTTSLPESSYRAVPVSGNEVVEIAADGTYTQSGHLQLWGLRNLPDPATTPLPADKDEAAESPWRDRIYDMDRDGFPGATTFVTGAVGGEVYIAQRKTVSARGVVLGPDRVVGLAVNTNEVVQLGNTNPLLDRQSEGSAGPHPDPKRSWFEEARLNDDADCDDVMAAEDDGILSRRPPFEVSAD